jgi:Type II CAAX prenyl endopeptidase Rce1-like
MRTRHRPVRRRVTLSGTGIATSAAQGRRRVTRALVTMVPVVVPLTMRLLFPALARRLGSRRGYLAGFGLYWAGCYSLAIGVLGRRRVQALVRHPARPLPSPRWLPAAALLLPPLGATGIELLPQLRSADPVVLATATTVASVNAAAEELLWHGLFVATFPDDPVRGWLWPAVGFTAWHLAPLSVRPYRHGTLAFLVPAGLIGAGYGWVAWRTGSLRLTLPAHIATDASGLRAARFWLGR